MDNFLANNQAFTVRSETDLANILSHFDAEFVFDVMENAFDEIENNFKPITLPNAIDAFEANFKIIVDNFPDDREDVIDKRDEIYYKIISIISNRFGFEFTIPDGVDSFASAKFIYDFFISNFDIYMINYLSDFIIRESDQIYKSLNLEQFKKDKDTTTIYSKKVYEDPNMAIICSHMDLVLQLIAGIDFDFEDIINKIYQNNINIMNIFGHVQFQEDFFRSTYLKIIFNPNLLPLVNTYLKIEIQRRTAPPDSPINFNF